MYVESYDRFILLKNNKGEEVARLTPDDAVELINQIKRELDSFQSCKCQKLEPQTNF